VACEAVVTVAAGGVGGSVECVLYPHSQLAAQHEQQMKPGHALSTDNEAGVFEFFDQRTVPLA
jgi:hypothetical protein